MVRKKKMVTFFKNATAFESKRRRVLKKRLEVLNGNLFQSHISPKNRFQEHFRKSSGKVQDIKL